MMSPPFRPKGHQEFLWRGLQAGSLHTTATDHCVFCAPQKAAGRSNFAQIPNGCGGVEERLAVLWHEGVNSGRLTPNEFVAITSANAARIFNLYPRKGLVAPGAAPPGGVGPVGQQDAVGERRRARSTTTSSKAARCGASPRPPSSERLVYAQGDLRTTRGAGRYLKRQPRRQLRSREAPRRHAGADGGGALSAAGRESVHRLMEQPPWN